MQGYESMQLIAKSITIEEVNMLARSLLSYISHYGSEAESAAEAAANPEEWLEWGASHATSIVACIPAYMDASGHSTGKFPPGFPLTFPYLATSDSSQKGGTCMSP